jgi:hypothetical protein
MEPARIAIEDYLVEATQQLIKVSHEPFALLRCEPSRVAHVITIPLMANVREPDAVVV